jgi:hypothetical protein
VTGDTWIDIDQADADNPDVINLARRMTRILLWSLNGMLVDMDGSMLEESDIRLIQEIAWAADSCVAAVGARYLDAEGKERRTPGTKEAAS